MDTPPQVKILGDDREAVIVGIGALDLYTESFGCALNAAALRAENIVVDLRAATYIDTAIIADLVGAANKMREQGKCLRVLLLAGTHPLRTLRITGLGAIMDIIEDSGESS